MSTPVDPASWYGHLIDVRDGGALDQIFVTAVRHAADGLVEVDGYIRGEWYSGTVDPAKVTVRGQ